MTDETDTPRFVRPRRIVNMNDEEQVAQAEREGRVAGTDPLEIQAMRLFAQTFEDRFRYNHTRGKWMEWTGFRWVSDEYKRAEREMIDLVDGIRQVDPANRRSLGKISFSKNALAGAQSDPRMAVVMGDFDNEKTLIGTPTGYVDLDTGEHHKPDRTKMLSKAVGVSPAKGKPKRWLEFLDFATGGDQDLVRYLQKFFGYCLSGLMNEEIMTFIYGPGGNGKGVMISVLVHVFGDYYVNTPSSTFMDTKKQEHATELARLNGARLVTASETEDGDKWNLSRIKEITGNENPISARFMRQDFFEFWATCKLMIVGNNKPAMGEVDAAIARRLRMIEFTQIPKKVDVTLKDGLAVEYGQILNWCIEGFRLYREEGLTPPECVLKASQAYLTSEDVVQQFLNQWCEFGSEGFVLLKQDIGMAVAIWAKENGITQRVPATRIYKRLRETYRLNDDDGVRYNNKRCFIGVRLTAEAWVSIGKELSKNDKGLDDSDGRRGIP